MISPLVTKLRRRDEVTPDEETALDQVLGPPRRVAAGAEVVQEHQRPEHSTLLLDGFCGRYTTLSDGARQITQLGVAGDFVDLHSFLMKHMDHGVVALTDCVVRPAPHSALKTLTETQPHLTRLLWLDTVIDGAVNRQWLTAMGRQSALSQLAHLVCELYLRLEAVGAAANFSFALPLTQVMLADVLGLSTVHVNRLVAELRLAKLVTWAQPRIRILDWDRLAVLGEFDPAYLRLRQEPV